MSTPTSSVATTFPAPSTDARGPIPNVSSGGAGGRSGGGGGPTASALGFGGPASGRPEIAATDEAMGEHMVEGMKMANFEAGANGRGYGILYWFNYKKYCERTGAQWDDKYKMGHTQASGFIQPHESGKAMDFELKKGHSASQAIKAWLAGPTVAECRSGVIALEIDTLRAAIGDPMFDLMFGSAYQSEDERIPVHQRMHITTNETDTPIAKFLVTTKVAKKAAIGGDFGTVDPAELDASLIPGQWYYFYNHPKYLLKHPGGSWQGENAIYMGKNEAGERMWSGLGAKPQTEDSLLDELVGAYNDPQTDHDLAVLKARGILNADGTFTDPRYDLNSGEFRETVTKEDVLTAPAYSLRGEERKGGFFATAGKALDAKKVEQARLP